MIDCTLQYNNMFVIIVYILYGNIIFNLQLYMKISRENNEKIKKYVLKTTKIISKNNLKFFYDKIIRKGVETLWI